MLNLFVPVKTPRLGPPVRGLRFQAEGEIQRDFAGRFAHDGGAFFYGMSGGPCLCGFADWESLYAIVRDVLARNAVEWVAVLHFWSGDRYPPSERTVDPEDPEACKPGKIGETLIVRAEPAERRRHRIVVRTLALRLGRELTLRLKNGRQLHGVLDAFDAESELGSIGGQAVVAAQVLAVETP